MERTALFTVYNSVNCNTCVCAQNYHHDQDTESSIPPQNPTGPLRSLLPCSPGSREPMICFMHFLQFI